MKFDGLFNQPIVLTDNIINLCLGRKFDNSIVFGKNLKYLLIGENFSQKIDLPNNIKYLKLFCNNQYIIDNLLAKQVCGCKPTNLIQ